MARPKPNLDMALAVAKELARGTPTSVVAERISIRFGVTTRCVRDYIAAAEEQRSEDDRALASKMRHNGVFVAQAASAKWIRRADKFYAAAARLLARADRLDGGDTAIGDRLARKLMALGVDLDDGERDMLADPIDIIGGKEALAIAREDRKQASMLVRTAEGCELRAAEWFEKAAKICGAYDLATAPTESQRQPLTSPQRRAKLEKLAAILREARSRGAIQ